MATPQQLASQSQGSGEEKIIKQSIKVAQNILETLVIEVNDAELQQLRYAHYLTRIYDELSVIARHHSPSKWEDLLEEWTALEQKYGPLDERRGRLHVTEWRERKRALSTLREALGMGLTRPTGSKNLSPPLRISAFNDCPLDCAVLVNAQEKRRKWA